MTFLYQKSRCLIEAFSLHLKHLLLFLPTTMYEGSYYLNNLNPVSIEICGSIDDGSLEISVTKDGDGLLLDFSHRGILNSLDDRNAVDIFSYIIEVK